MKLQLCPRCAPWTCFAASFITVAAIIQLAERCRPVHTFANWLALVLWAAVAGIVYAVDLHLFAGAGTEVDRPCARKSYETKEI